MAHSNSTQYYSLPQFESTDKPAWLVDVNPAYAAIDAGIHAAKAAADDAQSDATQALTDASTAGTTASGADAKATGSIASISDTFDTTATYNIGDLVIYNNLLYICIAAVTVPGAWTGSSNWNRTTLETEINKKLDHINSLTAASEGHPSSTDLLAFSDSSGNEFKANVESLFGSGKITPQAILTDTILTTSAADYSTYSDRKFSDYDLIIFRFGNSSIDTRRTVVLPSAIWTNGCVINEGVLHGASAATASSYNYSSFNINYNSDTSITALVSGSGTIAHMSIYGLKLGA